MNLFLKKPWLALSLIVFTLNSAQLSWAENPIYNSSVAIEKISSDPYMPVSRGYIEPTIEDLGGGKYRIHVTGNYAAANTNLTLTLQALANEGKVSGQDQLRLINLYQLGNNVPANPSPAPGGKQIYRSTHTFDIDASQINTLLEKIYPNNPGMRFEPGRQFFVHALFLPDGHQWGSYFRGGGIIVPGAEGKIDTTVSTRRLTDIDVSYPQTLLKATPLGEGLDANGNIGSKVEMEGKWALKDRAAFDTMQDRLMALAKNPNLTDANGNRILPTGWTIQLEDRYVLKDAKLVSNANPKGYVLDARGIPIADTMKDTASDAKNFALAKSDTIVRARFTQQNQTTVINAKPGGSGFVVDKDGIVQRVEYSAIVEGGDPAKAKGFFGSNHPLNFMKKISEASGITNPAEAIEVKTLEQAANRLKFKLTGPQGQFIEVSTDHVHAKSLLDPSAPVVEYFQMEADYEHRAVNQSGKNAASNVKMLSADFTQVDLNNINDPKNALYFQQVPQTGPETFLDGKPVLHSVEDLLPNSPFIQANAAELDLAKQAMVAIRDYAIGANEWIPAANKIAMSNILLGHFPLSEASPSVQRQFEAMEKKGWVPGRKIDISTYRCSTGFGVFVSAAARVSAP